MVWNILVINIIIEFYRNILYGWDSNNAEDSRIFSLYPEYYWSKILILLITMTIKIYILINTNKFGQDFFAVNINIFRV